MLSSILYIVGAIIALILVMDVVMYLKLYSKALSSSKNLKIVFEPRLYQFCLITYAMLVRKDLAHGLKTTVANIKETTDMVVLPSITGLQRMFIPRSTKAFKEFFKLENLNFERFNFIGVDGVLSHMFLKNGPAMKNRAFFSKIFHIKNMKKMLPGVRTIVKNHLERLEKKLKSDQKTKVGSKSKNENTNLLVVDVREDFMNALIDDLSTFLVFGNISDQNKVTIAGKTFVERTKDLFKGMIELIISPVNMLSFGLARKLGLDPALNKMQRINQEIKATSIAEYKKKFNELSSKQASGSDGERKGDEDLGDNCIINLMAKHNLEADKITNRSAQGDKVSNNGLGVT